MKSTSLWTLAVIAGALFATNMPLSAATRDDRIEASFQKTEIYQDNLRNDTIDIRSNNGNVTLSGTAANARHKMLAEDAARSLRGVESVQNHIKVADKCCAESSHTDQCAECGSCPPTYANGVPKGRFLTGEEPYICSKGNMDCSTSQRGPIDHYQTASDRSITQSIREAVYVDSSLDRAYNGISISTVKGHVTLTGCVATQGEKDNLQGKAREFVSGDMISNHIKVSKHACSSGNDGACAHRRGPMDHYQTQSDRAITESIRSAIYDDSSLDSAYNEITISTIKGHVTLNGTVATAGEREKIQAKARETVKDSMIHNEIMVARK